MTISPIIEKNSNARRFLNSQADVKLVGSKNNLGGQLLHKSPDPPKKTASHKTVNFHVSTIQYSREFVTDIIIMRKKD